MNGWDILIIAILAAAAAGVIYFMVRRRKKGRTCCGDCAACLSPGPDNEQCDKRQ